MGIASSPFHGEDGGGADKVGPRRGLFYAADYGNVQFADFLAQGVAIEARQMSGSDLVAAGGAEGQHDQRPFDFAQYPVV